MAWLAVNAETDKGTLLIEIQTANKSKEDKRWDQFLLREVPSSALEFFKNRDCGRSATY
jgi:hypothetical protein